MDARIFDCGESLPKLVMFRDTDDDCDPIVKLRAVELLDDDMDNWMEEDIVFGSKASARNFIKNYDSVQAQEWLEERINQE